MPLFARIWILKRPKSVIPWNTIILAENLIHGIKQSASLDDKIKAKYSLREYKTGLNCFAILSTVNVQKVPQSKQHSR